MFITYNLTVGYDRATAGHKGISGDMYLVSLNWLVIEEDGYFALGLFSSHM